MNEVQVCETKRWTNTTGTNYKTVGRETKIHRGPITRHLLYIFDSVEEDTKTILEQMPDGDM